MMALLFFIPALLCLVVSAVLAAAEAALLTVSHQQVAEAREDKQRGANHVAAILADLPTHVNVLTFVRQFLEALATVFIALAFNGIYDASLEMVVLTVITASIAVFVIAGVSPRTLGRRRSLAVSLGLGWLVSGLRRALGPVARVLVWMGNMLTPDRVYRDGPFVTEEQLIDLVERASASDIIEDEERDMIQSVFELGQTRAKKVMVPRTDLVTMSDDIQAVDAMTLFLRSGFSRIPVIGRDVDDVRGVLYLKDLARHLHLHPEAGTSPVQHLLREVSFVPETKAADELLRQMQLESNHVAVVVDEYGGTAGIITIEDIVEEIVGEIDDEYDRSDEEIVATDDGGWLVNTRTHLDDFADHFDIRIDDELAEDVTTVFGLLTKLIGRVPIADSHAEIAGLQIRALPGQGRRHQITHVLVTPVADPADEEQKETSGVQN